MVRTSVDNTTRNFILTVAATDIFDLLSECSWVFELSVLSFIQGKVIHS